MFAPWAPSGSKDMQASPSGMTGCPHGDARTGFRTVGVIAPTSQLFGSASRAGASHCASQGMNSPTTCLAISSSASPEVAPAKRSKPVPGLASNARFHTGLPSMWWYGVQ